MDRVDLQLQHGHVDERGQKTIVAVETIGDPAADTAEVVDAEHVGFVLGKEMGVKLRSFPGPDARTHEQLAEADEKQQMDHVLDGERVGKRRIVAVFEQQRRTEAVFRKDQRQHQDEDAAGEQGQDRGLAP